MGFSAIGLEATGTIISNQGLAVNSALLPTLTSYNSLPTVSLATALFNTASSVSDAGQLSTALRTLGNTGAVLYGVAPNTGIPNFTSNIVSQANAPFTNGVAGFANVVMQVMPYILQSFEIVGSAKLLKDKTYNTSGPGYSSRQDLVSGGMGLLSNTIGQTVSKFGTMYSIKNIANMGDPYVFTHNLLVQGFGKTGNLSANLGSIGLTIDNILSPPSDVPGSSPRAVISVLSNIKGQDLADIISATRFTSVSQASLDSLADLLILSRAIPNTTFNVLSLNRISTIQALGNFITERLGNGTFSSFDDLSSVLLNLIVPSLTTESSASDAVVSASVLDNLISAVGSGTGPFGNPTIIDVLGSCAGLPYNANFGNITSIVSGVDTTTVLTNLGQVYSAANTYISGGVFNSTTLAPVVTSIQNLTSNASILLNSSRLSTAQSLYYSSYTHYQNEVSLINTSGIVVSNPGTTPNRLSDLARTISSIGVDSNQFGLVQFFMSIATSGANGDSIRSVIAENYNSHILQNRGIPFDNTVQPAQKLAQAQKFGVSIDTLQQLSK